MAEAEILEEITDICESTTAVSLQFRLESTKDIVIRSAKDILQEALYQRIPVSNYEPYLNLQRYMNLLSYFRGINTMPLFQNGEPVSLDNSMFSMYRTREIKLTISPLWFRDMIEHEENLPVLEHEPNQGSSPASVLWQKFETAESLTQILEEAGQKNCSICLKEDITTRNFAILDKCKHLFCHDCITVWFQNK